MKKLIFLILAVFTAIVSLERYAAAQQVSFTLDFEDGSLRGWTPTGDAFRFQPTLGDNPTARGRGQPSRHQGRYWIGTYEKYQGRPGQKPGDVQGDQPRGMLISNYFVVPPGKLTFLIGGGSSLQTRVELYSQDPDASGLPHATGKDSESMSPVTWDLTPYVGRRMQIRIVDDSSGPWGHINVDDFRFIPPGASPGTFVPPKMKIPGKLAPAETLVAQIAPRSLEVKQGEVAEFRSNSSPADNIVGQKWTGPGNQSASGPIFRLPTQGIEPGRHRISLTVTDRRGQSAETEAALVVQSPPEPGYRLQAAVQPSRIDAGGSVTIKAILTPALDGVEYRFSYGDQSTSDWARQPATTHAYSIPGEYYVSVTARRARRAKTLAASAETGPIIASSNRIRVTVEDSFTVVLRPDRDSVYVDEPVVFRLAAGKPLENARYYFSFGDSQSSNWISDDRIEHIYSNEGSYNASAEVNSGTRTVKSPQVTIRVQRRPSVRLRLSRSQARPGEDIVFSADLNPPVADPQFNFSFGNGQSSGWIASPQTSHRYSGVGSFDARVVARQGGRILSQSEDGRIRIRESADTQASPPSISLSIDQASAEVGETLHFTALLMPPDQRAEYRFSFGDGLQTEWNRNSSAEHVYRQAANYKTLVTARVGQDQIAESPQIVVAVTPIANDNGMIKAIMIAAAAILIFIVGYFLKKPSNKVNQEDNPSASPKDPKITPESDAGRQSVDSSRELITDQEIQLRFFPDQGSQIVENGSILSETIAKEEM